MTRTRTDTLDTTHQRHLNNQPRNATHPTPNRNPGKLIPKHPSHIRPTHIMEHKEEVLRTVTTIPHITPTHHNRTPTPQLPPPRRHTRSHEEKKNPHPTPVSPTAQTPNRNEPRTRNKQQPHYRSRNNNRTTTARNQNRNNRRQTKTRRTKP